jgi:hypothetical protein
MPEDIFSFDMVFDGGWSTDLGRTLGRFNVEGAIGQGLIKMPWLTEAEDVYYELDGRPHKAWGATKLNSVAISGTPIVIGLFEFYKIGTSGSTVRKRLAHAGTVIYKEDLDGTWDELKTGLESGKIPDYTVFNDLVIISSDSPTDDVPFSWDQTTFQNLAGDPPNFAFSAKHRNRLWAAGDASQPSRLYYTGNGDPTDWSGSGSGAIDIDRDDGDKITGIKSHKGDLWVFKGPNVGSIHRIVGSAPTGNDFFKHINYTNEVGAANNRVIIDFGSDLAFMNVDGTWHLLTEAQGTQRFRNASLSAPINEYIDVNVDKSELDKAVAVNWVNKGLVLCALATDTSTTTSPNTVTNDTIIGFDYRFDPPRWFRWRVTEDQGAASLTIFEDSTGRRVPAIGQYDGFVLLGGNATRSWNGKPINFKIRTPFTNLGSSGSTKTLNQIRLGRETGSVGETSIDYFLDSGVAITKMIPQQPSAVLDNFILDVDVLGENDFDTYVLNSVEGEFRDISFRVRHIENSGDLDMPLLGLSIENVTPSAEN